jgi:hypothetical protein
MVLTLARIAIWGAVCGGVVFFGITWLVAHPEVLTPGIRLVASAVEPIVGKIGLHDAATAVDQLEKIKDTISEFWHLASAALVSCGALGARAVYRTDRRINGTWHWVATVTEGNHLLSVSQGTMVIKDIDVYRKRRKNAAGVLSGSMSRSTTLPGETAGHNGFHATDIVMGRPATRRFFYEWEYVNGISATGLTKVVWEIVPQPGRNSVVGRALRRIWPKHSLLMVGRFMADNTPGSGTINYHQDEAAADRQYRAAQASLAGYPRAAE